MHYYFVEILTVAGDYHIKSVFIVKASNYSEADEQVETILSTIYANDVVPIAEDNEHGFYKFSSFSRGDLKVIANRLYELKPEEFNVMRRYLDLKSV